MLLNHTNTLSEFRQPRAFGIAQQYKSQTSTNQVSHAKSGKAKHQLNPKPADRFEDCLGDNTKVEPLVQVANGYPRESLKGS